MAYALLGSFASVEEIAKAPNDGKQTGVIQLANSIQDEGYDVLCVPLTTDRWRQRWTETCISSPGDDESSGDRDREQRLADEKRAEDWRSQPAFKLDEVTMTRLDEAQGVVVVASEWLELDAADDWVRHDAAIALQQELAYAAYLGIQSVILPRPRTRAHVASYARIVNACLKSVPYVNLSIRLPIYDPSTLDEGIPAAPFVLGRSPRMSSASMPGTPQLLVSEETRRAAPAPERELNTTWEMWDLIRTMCDYNTRLSLGAYALDLALALPSTIGVLNRWSAEPVRHIFLPASTFIANAKGYPVLSKITQSFLRASMTASHQPTIILSGTKDGVHERGGGAAYVQYVRHLERTSPVVRATETEGTVEHFAQGYQDYLQAPLQPLQDNLQSATYETFERDPVKYHQYEEVCMRRLGTAGPTICVAGAGRGPLVARALNALQRAKKDAKIYAVEKNPNAFVTLQRRKSAEWGDRVALVYGDMRMLDVPAPADILVSELLGSFGDNELSPECLDGAQRFLKPDGISIPSSYTAHLAPLSSAKLYNEARSGASASGSPAGLETPYVVMLQAVNVLSGDGPGVSGACGSRIQECWSFDHPRRDALLDNKGLPFSNSHNVRSAKLKFHIPHAGVMHGLAGYFEAVLYGTIGLSIHPERKNHVSKDMLSWFPLFFPFREPLYLPSNSELHVSIWRLTSTRQVWYEWHAEAFLAVQAMAPPGQSAGPVRSSSLGLLSPGVGAFDTPVPASPLIDAVDVPAFVAGAGTSTPGEMPGTPVRESGLFKESGLFRARGEPLTMIKIGQTNLHNPGGRSSWIGL
ncbi:PRMT5 arginine-N-methyltransferase-domain-containing protein [Schizophyllum fasciatum]